jgi:hypothetical protein
MRGEEDFGGQRTPFRVETTGLVRESNQVRLGAYRVPNGLLIYMENRAINSARRETSHRITNESVSDK